MHEQFDWDDLRYFLAAAQRGGFGAAARVLKTQQSTVSRRVATLETRLGGALFDRTASGLTVTRLGEEVRREAEQMASALTRVSDAATSTEKEVDGLVRIALTETLADVFVIPHVLPELMKKFPRLKLDLVIGNASADLGRREAEIALRFFLTPSGDLVTKRVARMPTEVLARPSLAKKLVKLPMSQWPFVVMWLPGSAIQEETWREKHAPQDSRLSTNSFHAQVEAVRFGLGVAVLPTHLTNELGLVVLERPAGIPAPPPLDLYLVTPRTLRKVPRVAAVYGALEDAFTSLS
ncbi:MAG: LysR family transcriptional regulator [Archangium sp.]